MQPMFLPGEMLKSHYESALENSFHGILGALLNFSVGNFQVLYYRVLKLSLFF